jgi:phosphate starvation-inducible protein PhoH and related proteins
MSKKKKRLQNQQQQNHFSLRTISPLTLNQSSTFKAFEQGKHLLLHGVAGTGKTYISLYLALNEVLNKSRYKQIVIIRSVVPSRDMGFLPGTAKDKARVYEDPYKMICDDLFSRGDGYEILKTKRLVDFNTTSFLRGVTFNDAIIIVDECQNMIGQELDTVMTRVGNNCRIVFCGDFRQTDLAKHEEKRGLLTFMNILDKMSCFEKIEFGKEDIVRSALVKSYIISKLELGYV